MQQGTTRAHVSYIYHLFSVHSQSIVRSAFEASGSSSAIFLSALTNGILVLSRKGTWRKSVKVKRGGDSLQIITIKHPIKCMPHLKMRHTS